MSNQSSLDLSNKADGPVECLGESFPSEEARREHYLGLLAEKLKDPDFRKIEGFPIGEDEDILALSDPPYYTACPNPWIGDFIKHYGRPYDPKEKYHREPFAADVSEGKNHPIYNAHSYHTKVPHRAIMRYILHYTEPGDIVFDGFCGTGMTGVAAQLCGDKEEVQELGYRVDGKGVVYDQSGVPISKLGYRKAVLSDLSPIATFIASNFNGHLDQDALHKESATILQSLDHEHGWMFKTKHTDQKTIGHINFVVWSEVIGCPECAAPINYWIAALNRDEQELKDLFKCPSCGAIINKKMVERIVTSELDEQTNTLLRATRFEPVLINYSLPGNAKRYEKSPDDADLEVIKKCNKKQIAGHVPAYPMLFIGEKWGDSWRAGMHSGLTHSHQFYTKRSLHVLTGFFDKATSSKVRQLKFIFTSAHQYCLRLCRLHIGNYFSKKGGLVDKPLDGTLYMPSISVETNPIDRIRLRSRIGSALFTKPSHCFIETRSLTSASQLPANSMDYLFLDPPFGGNLMYSELNFLWECWLRVWTSQKREAIENGFQSKGPAEYEQLMAACFREAYRLLKPGRWLTVEFSNTRARTWNAIQVALQEAGFVVANVSSIDKQKVSFKAVTNPTSVKQDLVISAYKPNGGLEDRFRKTGHTVDGVWDFMKTHLRNLPVVKPRGGELEFVTERDPRILYDRMVAFYVGHGVPVPLSSAEFQAALAEKYPEREGMFFLPDQVDEWDKKRAQMQGVGQMSIFVEDEKSAIDWLRGYLKQRPSTYQDFAQEFMQQLNASWKKFETRPELHLLLEQNFLQYDGKGDVPSQIHSYLSTQNKDLRGLPKDDARLQSRGKDRWYVPDPAKAVDVEAIRNKRLLQEFWELCDQAGISRPNPQDPSQPTLAISTPVAAKKGGRKKLKEVRTEAIRIGFKECFGAKNYATILAIADHLPDNVIEEDEQLQMIHDMAEMRSEG